VNGPLFAAGLLSLAAAAVHGGAGEVLVLRRLFAEKLPTTRFGGERMTRAMVHVTWHVATAAFLMAGAALLAAGTVLDGDAALGAAVGGAAGMTAYGLIASLVGLAYMRSPASLRRHPGPLALMAAAALAWWGVALL
jgi:hypothetical protein